jgi:hypothetical protein
MRRTLLKGQNIDNIYVPFIGDGDIANELYTTYKIYGGDIDPTRANYARERLKATIKAADCNKWIFQEVKDEFQAADFDSYCQPYLSFREFWNKANKSNILTLFFTDGHRQSIIRTGTHVTIDDTHVKLKDINEQRKLYNAYFTGYILPWFVEYIKPYKIIKKQFYLRQHMLYWGAVVKK